jgi:hypothetical protein
MRVRVLEGHLNVAPHPTNKKLLIQQTELVMQRGNWFVTIPAGFVFNGASIPWPFSIWLDPHNEDWLLAALIHDALIGERGKRISVISVGGIDRILTWKEGASWFRDILKMDYDEDGERDNRKIIRRTFYHAVMLKSRLGFRK